MKRNEWNENIKEESIDFLSNLILDKSLTFGVIRCFRPLVLELFGRIISRNDKSLNLEEYERIVILLSNLLKIASPLLLEMAIEFFERSPFFFDNIISRQKYEKEDKEKMVELLIAARNLLTYSPIIKHIWDWSILIKFYSQIKEKKIKNEMARVISILYNFQESTKWEIQEIHKNIELDLIE